MLSYMGACIRKELNLINLSLAYICISQGHRIRCYAMLTACYIHIVWEHQQKQSHCTNQQPYMSQERY